MGIIKMKISYDMLFTFFALLLIFDDPLFSL